MKKIIGFVMACLLGASVYAAQGDTLKLRVHDKTHLNWNGSFNDWGLFPDAATDFRKAIMHFTLGCPDHGCSGWDYTIQVFALEHTGLRDTVEVKQPVFTVNGEEKEVFSFSRTPNYVRFFDTVNQKVDSVEAESYGVVLYKNPEKPMIKSDSIHVWKANYYVYDFDAQGKVVDSSWVEASDTYKLKYRLYTAYPEKVKRYELMRMMTPYSADKTKEWSLTYDFEVTDFLPVLHDSVEIELFYSGWQDGFTVSLDFDFIEGTPARKPLRVENIWQSGKDGFKFGDAKDPIENYMPAYPVRLQDGEQSAKIRLVPSGHSFGGEEHCAEFCAKHFYLKINQKPFAETLIWKDDCGFNPIYPQTGTWVFDRANWCPGTLAVPHDFEITPFLSEGQTDSLRIDFEAYTYTTGAGIHPMYVFESLLFAYGEANCKNDVALDAILSPNNHPLHSRYDLLTSQAAVLIQNMGSDDLQSVKIRYGFEGADMQEMLWDGSLAFMEKDTVILPGLDWVNQKSGKFVCELRMPNDKVDEYPMDNRQIQAVSLPDVYKNTMIVQLKTNKQASENRYVVLDAKGEVVFKRDQLENETLYQDTLHLPDGAYTLRLEDDGKDGLTFWFNPDAGSGYVKLLDHKGRLQKLFNDDFGTRIVYSFVVGKVGYKEKQTANAAVIYCTDEKQAYLFRSHKGKASYALFDGTAKELVKDKISCKTKVVKIDMQEYPRGLYQLVYKKKKKKQLLRFINR